MFAGYRGVARIWQWAKNIFFTFGNWKFLCYMHSKVIPTVMGNRGHIPPIIVLQTVQFFGYFDQILS